MASLGPFPGPGPLFSGRKRPPFCPRDPFLFNLWTKSVKHRSARAHRYGSGMYTQAMYGQGVPTRVYLGRHIRAYTPPREHRGHIRAYTPPRETGTSLRRGLYSSLRRPGTSAQRPLFLPYEPRDLSAQRSLSFLRSPGTSLRRGLSLPSLGAQEPLRRGSSLSLRSPGTSLRRDSSLLPKEAQGPLCAEALLSSLRSPGTSLRRGIPLP